MMMIIIIIIIMIMRIIIIIIIIIIIANFRDYVDTNVHLMVRLIPKVECFEYFIIRYQVQLTMYFSIECYFYLTFSMNSYNKSK